MASKARLLDEAKYWLEKLPQTKKGMYELDISDKGYILVFRSNIAVEKDLRTFVNVLSGIVRALAAHDIIDNI